ncbi:MAG: Glyoxalase/bleomycin resistance protein/dioxygenase [Thermoleophilia bacterium]|nr:Glyoxalase/bleomycin resistance protein/dioxygenase [Thermoleophilia bacterium]
MSESVEAATPMVAGVDYVMVPVEDLDRARAFYTDTLGLQPGPTWGGETRPMIGAEFETGTVTIALMDVGKVGGSFSTGAGAIALQVDAVEARRAELEAAGVTFRMDTIDSSVCLQAIFPDSEGNTLILHNRYAPRE